MKKFLFAAFVPLFYFIITSLPFFAIPAKAEDEGYACILTDHAYFYASESEQSGLFILPKTYYVKVLLPSYPYTKVEYLSDGANSRKLIGYCLTSDLTFVDYTPKMPYLFKTFEVTYTANGDANDPFLNKITVTCSYYGDYTVGSKNYAYVLQGDSFGYVPKPSDFFFTENPEYAEHLKENPPQDSGEEAGSSSPLQIAILIVLCLLVPILAAAVFRSSKKRPYDFEEDDLPNFR